MEEQRIVLNYYNGYANLKLFRSSKIQSPVERQDTKTQKGPEARIKVWEQNQEFGPKREIVWVGRSDSNGNRLALKDCFKVSTTIYSLLLRSGRNVMCGWDGFIERSSGGTVMAQCKMCTLNP